MATSLTCSSENRLWINPATGHQYEEGERGRLLNGQAVPVRPAWVWGEPLRFGPVTAWAGGACPVPPATVVRCFFRARRPYSGPAIWPHMPPAARVHMWQHAPSGPRVNPGSDIVAYQVAHG